MASKLYVQDGSNQVQVAELGLIASKQQMILGDSARDLILRTSGNIQIQVGNKFYPLNFNTDSTTGSSSSGVTVSNGVTIVNTPADLAALTYPGDGSFVYQRSDKSFYIALDGGYIKLNNSTTSTSKVYLAYDVVQTLTGEQKQRVILNTGSAIDTIASVASLDQSSVYPNQFLYAYNEGRHYRLIDPNNPTLVASWKEIYLNLQDGGNVLGGVTISADQSDGQTLSALQIAGDWNATQFAIPTSLSSIFSIGSKDYSSGLAGWTNAGQVYLQVLGSDYHNGFTFLTTSPSSGIATPLNIAGNSVGIGGDVNYNYNLAVNGTSYLTGNTTTRGDITSYDFLSGKNGSGFSISRDSGNIWSLEIDKVLVRQPGSIDTVPNSGYITNGLQGSQIVNYAMTVTFSDLVETFGIYITASVAGRYSNTSGTTLPYSSRSRRVKVVHIATADLDTENPAKTYEEIILAYAIGDIKEDGTADTTTTYNRAADGSYYTPVGDTSYDSGTNTFIPDISGTLVEINSISVYYISSTSQSTIAVGDLLYFKEWDDSKRYSGAIHAEVIAVDADGYYIYAYDSATIIVGSQFIKIGSTAGTGAFMQTNAADVTNPFTELQSGIISLNDLYRNYYIEFDSDYPSPDDLIENNYSKQSLTRVKIGDLSNIVDTDLSLTTQQYGLYSDNAYIKGNLVVNKGIYNSIPVVTSYEPFLMLNTDKTMQQVDLSAKIATWDAIAAGGPYQPLENQRLSTTNAPTFAGLSVVTGTAAFSGWIESAVNLGGVSLSGFYNTNSFGKTLIGQNRSSAGAETNLICAAGTDPFAKGGFKFIIVDLLGAETQVLDINGTSYATTLAGSIVPGIVSSAGSITSYYLTLNPTTGAIEKRPVSDFTGGGGGTVTSVTSANGDITVATTTTTPVLTLAGMNGVTKSYYDPTSSIQTQLNSKAATATTLAGYGITDAYPLSGNPSSFLTGITGSQVTTALGYTPYNSTNPSGYITGFTETDPTVPSYSKSLTAFSVIKTSTDALYYPLSGNPSGFLTSFTETDPTVPSYAKSLTAFSVIQTSTDALYPSKTGSGASGSWGINITGNSATTSSVAWSGVSGSPTNVSYFTNDAGYITSGSGGSSTFTLVSSQHYSGAPSAGAPTITAEVGAGSSPTLGIGGYDSSHQIYIHPGSSPLGSNNAVCFVQFDVPFPDIGLPLKIFLSPGNNLSAALTAAEQVYAQPSLVSGNYIGYFLYSGGTALTSGFDYTWYVWVIQ